MDKRYVSPHMRCISLCSSISSTRLEDTHIYIILMWWVRYCSIIYDYLPTSCRTISYHIKEWRHRNKYHSICCNCYFRSIHCVFSKFQYLV
jgi:hypothetical protein